jgi:thioredoxin-like negative regulator of GroEL
VTAHTSVVVHFYHDEFVSCKVMDKHLRGIAPRAIGARFLRLNAKKAPFFTAKLKVKVLPTLVFFKDGVATGRQTGFEGLVSSATDEDFPTARLMRHLAIAGVLGDAAAIRAAEGDGDDDEEEDGAPGGDRLERARAAMMRVAVSADDE